MRAFLVNSLVFLFCCAYANGQVYFLDEHFNTAASLPPTMTGSGGFSALSSAGNYGRDAPSLQFRINGQFIQHGPWASAADQVSFFHKCLTSSGSSFLVEESVNGSAWTSVGTVVTITTGATYSAPLLSTSRYIRMSFTLAAAGAFVMVDDFRVRKTATLCTTPPRLLELLISACGTCESSNEFVFFDTGGNPMPLQYLEIVSQGSPAGGCAYGGNGPGDNTTVNWTLSGAYTVAQNNYIANLNLWAGCPGVFVPIPPGNVIPAGKRAIAFMGAIPDATYNFSSICSLGTVYILFATQAVCTPGHYGNNGCASSCNRFLTLFNHQTGCVDNQQYTASSSTLPNGNGYIFVPPVIGHTIGASCSFLILSAKIKSLIAREENGKVQLNWITLSEENMREYVVQRSGDDMHFKSIGSVYSLNSTGEEHYSFWDTEPQQGRNYYRLVMWEWNDNQEFSHIVEADFSRRNSPFVIINDGYNISLRANSDIFGSRLTIYSASGQIFFDKVINLAVGSVVTISSVQFPPGIYFIYVSESSFDVMKMLVR